MLKDICLLILLVTGVVLIKKFIAGLQQSQNHLEFSSFGCASRCSDSWHISSWIRNNVNGNSGILFYVACWIIWKARNREIFQDNTWNHWNVLHQIQNPVSLINQNLDHTMSIRLTHSPAHIRLKNIEINIVGRRNDMNI